MDGLLNLDEFAEQTGIELPDGPYETVAGYVLAVLGHLPGDGEAVEAAGRKLAVTEMDGRRISRVRVSQPPPVIDADQRPGPAARLAPGGRRAQARSGRALRGGGRLISGKAALVISGGTGAQADTGAQAGARQPRQIRALSQYGRPGRRGQPRRHRPRG